MAMTAATSTRAIVERPDTVACMEPDVSMTTSVPSSAGMLRDGSSRVRPEGPLPVVRRRVLVGRPHLVREQPGPGHLGRVGDLGDHRSDGLVADAGLVEVAQVADEGHDPHRRDDGLPRLGVHASRQPAGSRSHEVPASARAAGPRRRSNSRRTSAGTAARSAAAASTGNMPASATASSWWRRSSRYRNRADWRSSRRCRVGELDDVGHAQLAG